MNTMERLNELLDDRELTLSSLCQMTGLTRAAFTNAKKRDNQLRFDTIEMVCDALHIPVYQFFMTDADWKELDMLWRGTKHGKQN